MSLTNPVATIDVKDFGKIVVMLYPDVAKNTVDNFIDLALNNAYNGSIFHRVIKNFMIQGGATNKGLSPINGEFTSNGFKNLLKHERGIISMARTSDPNSATSQFFIVHKNSPHLDGAYASFGQVIEGIDVVDLIAGTRTNHLDRPISDVVINQVTIELNNYQPSKPNRL